VIKLHGSDTYFCHLDARPVKKVNFRREQKALMTADAWSSVSEYVAKITQKIFGFEQDFQVIPNGIDLEKFSINQTLNQEKPQTILYFGTLIRKKGLLELPLIFNEVYKQNPQAKLILIGRDASDIITQSPSTWQLMQSLFADDARNNVSYLGSVPYDEIKSYIESSSVCVFPTFAEALPVSWLEAMAMQKAIVASNIGWANEIIEDGLDGFLVSPLDHKTYAQKINNILTNDILRAQIGENAREKVIKKFSKEVIAQKNAAFYKQISANYKIRKS
jgi:glycosyltransferase involved in cell wall biosynthesis